MAAAVRAWHAPARPTRRPAAADDRRRGLGRGGPIRPRARRGLLDRATAWREARPADLRWARRGRVTRAGAAPRAIDTSSASSTSPAASTARSSSPIAGGSDPGDFVCSATAVDSNQHTLVWTAGPLRQRRRSSAAVSPATGSSSRATPTARSRSASGRRPACSPPPPGPTRQDIRQDLGAARLVRDAAGPGDRGRRSAPARSSSGSRAAQQFTAFGYPAEPTLFEPTFDGERLYSVRLRGHRLRQPARRRPGPDADRLRHDRRRQRRRLGERVRRGERAHQLRLHRRLLPPVRPYFGAEARALYERRLGPAAALRRRPRSRTSAAPERDDFSGGAGAETFKLGGSARPRPGQRRGRPRVRRRWRRRAEGRRRRRRRCAAARRATSSAAAPGIDLCIGGPGRDRGPGCEQRRQVP